MASNLEYLLEQGACIPEDMLLDYAAGRLTSPQSHLVEKHILECELCSDALEGLKMMHPSKSKEIIAELNKEIGRRVQSAGNSGAKVIPFNVNYKIAAVITLFILFGGGYLYFKNRGNEKMLAQKTPPSTTVISDSISPQLIPQTNSDQNAQAPVSSQPKFSLAEKSPAPQSTRVLSENKDIKPANEIRKNEDDAKTYQNDNSILTDNFDVTPVKATSPSQGQVSEDVKTEPSLIESIKSARDEKEKNQESGYDREAAPADLFSLNVIFSKAKNNYKQKKYSEAANDFEKLLNDTATSFYDDAKWMLANCYMHTSRNAKAVKLLREIAHSNSIHRKEAEDLLQE